MPSNLNGTSISESVSNIRRQEEQARAAEEGARQERAEAARAAGRDRRRV